MQFFKAPAFLGASLALAAAPAVAQNTHDEAVWINTTVSGRAADRVVFFAEVQPRVTDGVTRLSQLLLRPAIGWEVSDRVSVYQGYAHVIEPLENGPDRTEDRLFQQVTWNVGKLGTVEIQSRTRLEQRWRSDGDGMSLRARQLVRVEQPLAPGDKRLAMVGSIEGFAGLTSAEWRGTTGFDQVRTFVGLEIPLAGSSTIEAGYLNQTRDAPGRRVDMTHVLSLTFAIRM